MKIRTALTTIVTTTVIASGVVAGTTGTAHAATAVDIKVVKTLGKRAPGKIKACNASETMDASVTYFRSPKPDQATAGREVRVPAGECKTIRTRQPRLNAQVFADMGDHYTEIGSYRINTRSGNVTVA